MKGDDEVMKVKLVFDAQFCGRIEETVDIPDDASEEEIKALFPKVLGMEFDDSCFWKIEEDASD